MMQIIKDLKKENKQIRAKSNSEIIGQLDKAKADNLALEKIIKNE